MKKGMSKATAKPGKPTGKAAKTVKLAKSKGKAKVFGRKDY